MADRDIHSEQILEELRKTKSTLREIKLRLAEGSEYLADVSNTLNELVNDREGGRIEFNETILTKVQQLFQLSLGELKGSRLSSRQAAIVRTLELSLNEIASPIAVSLSSSYFGLTPSEVRVAHLVRDGLTTKEIAALLYLSEYTIKSHRSNIRRKLKLKNKQINLTSHLRSMQE
jgi:DNA-binding NarL/FixJ family response regulator